MTGRFYVYVYFRLDGSPCYIGKGCGKRWLHHEQKGKCSNPRLEKIIAESGGNLPKIKVRQHLTDAQAREIETALILAIGRGRKGPLVNMTDGGEGIAGTRMPADIREKISKSNKGKTLSPETRAKLSASRKAMFAARRAAGIETRLSPEHREAISRGNLGKVISADARAKMSAAKKGRPIKNRYSPLGIKQSPEHIAKRVASTLATKRGIAVALGNAEGF